jgi:uncharacterized protein with HEPN domain
MVNSIKSEQFLLKQALDAIATIEYDIKDVDEKVFLEHHTIVRACLMMLVHIAECIMKIKKIQPHYDFVEDDALRGMRNIIAHDYLAIRGNFIKQAVYHKLPLLKEKIQHYLNQDG